jgi:hypothetical protein
MSNFKKSLTSLLKGAAIALFVLAAAPAASTYAQTSASKSPEYKKAISEGLQEFAHGNYPEARAAFERAHAVAPNARTLRGMGLSAFESRDYLAAIGLLTQAIAHAEQPLTDTQRKEAVEVIARAQGNVATLEIELTPSTAALLVDGQPVLLQAGRLTLNPGEHRIEAHADGHESFSLTVDAQPGHTTKHLLVLRQPGVATPLVIEDHKPVTQATSAPPPSEQRSIGPYLLGGGGALVLITSAITGALTSGAESDLRDSCATGTCDESARDSGKTLQVTTNVLLPVGVAMLAGAVVWWILDTPEERALASRTRVLAGCSASGCGVGVQGSFF